MTDVATTDVAIPGKAVSADAKDVSKPTRDQLESLWLLGTKDELDEAKGFKSIFEGPPQSVAVIEAGATALAKWWAAGLSAAVVVTWARIWSWWGDQSDGVREATVGSAAFVTAAIAVAIGYLLASDVRGRSAAAVATIEARYLVAIQMIQAAQGVYKPAASMNGNPAAGGATTTVQRVPLQTPIAVKNIMEEGTKNEEGWFAVASEVHGDGSLKYVLVKGSSQATVDISKVRFK